MQAAKLRQADFDGVERVLELRASSQRESGVKRTVNSLIREDTRKILGYREEHLDTFEKLDYESDLDAPADKGRRLVDYKEVAWEQGLWYQLISFRRRVYGLRALKQIWHGIRQRDIMILPQLSHGVNIWTDLVQLGLEDHEILRELCDYAKLVYEKGNGSHFTELYYMVLDHFFRNDLDHAYQWHSVLMNFPPGPRQCMLLFDRCCENYPALTLFRKIYAELPQLSLYSSILRYMFQRRLFDEAVSWHFFLMEKGDIPPSRSVTEPLINYLTLQGRNETCVQITRGLVEAGVSFANTIDTTSKDNNPISRAKMNDVHAAFHNFSPKEFNDSFCARLFATTMFSVHTSIKGLHMLGVQAIGPLSLREMVIRTISDGACDTEAVRDYLTKLHLTDISIGCSTFSRVVTRLADASEGQTLYDVVTCDQHPDVFDDWKVQESLLAAYQEAGDQRQINRTVAVLTSRKIPPHQQTAQWNLFFRSCLTRNDMEGMNKIIEAMLDKRIELQPTSRKFMWSSMVTERRSPQGPYTTDELPMIVKIWRNFMRTGTYIDPEDWVEILRRLGMDGKLKQYEELALWLAKWYSDATFRKAQEGLVAARKSVRVDERRIQHCHSAYDAFQTLFPLPMQQAVLAWGFQQNTNTEVKGISPTEQSQELSHGRWLWGLRMLAKLRDCGVVFVPSEVERACTLRLIALFGARVSGRSVNRHNQARREGSIEGFMLAMESIWSPELFIPETATISALEKWRRIKKTAKKIMKTGRLIAHS